MRLACVTVPNFRIALERARAPELAGHPVAIGEPPPGANEIIDCSPEASALGIRTDTGRFEAIEAGDVTLR